MSYINPGTPIVWDSATAATTLTLTSLGAGTGRQGDLLDLRTIFGNGLRPARYSYRLYFKLSGVPTVNEVVELYLKTSDGNHPDNDDGVTDAGVSAEDKLLNLTPVDVAVVDEAAVVELVASGTIENLDAPLVAPVVWNRTSDAFSATASDHAFILTPVPFEAP